MTTYPRAGKPVVGGCKDCSAISIPTELRPGAFAMVTKHSDLSCPFYRRLKDRLDKECK